MNLIEELGIEKARAIVDGVPSGATDYSNEDGEIIYYQKTNNLIYWDSELGLWDEVYFSMPELKSLPELRTAITDYECDHDWEDISNMGGAERQLICTYCSMKKSEPFGLNAQQFDGGD
jgi:hypothetical protein